MLLRKRGAAVGACTSPLLILTFVYVVVAAGREYSLAIAGTLRSILGQEISALLTGTDFVDLRLRAKVSIII